MPRLFFSVWMGALFLAAPTVSGEVYQQPRAFLEQAFGAQVPAAQALWITRPRQQRVREILGHRLAALRVRYWQQGSRTAWVLEEIGKEKPITTGIVIEDGAIQKLRVLIFRESRGWEVRHRFFTQQFRQARLQGDGQLDRPIDGVSGATLSVRALKKLARLALYLDTEARTQRQAAQ